MKVAATTISVVTILGSAAWFYFEPGFEPALTSLAGISGLLWSFSSPHKPRNQNQYKRQFDALKARWDAEKEIKPASLDDARWLLSEALDFLSDIRIAENSDEHHSKIDELTQRIKVTQSMQMFIDGGKSYAEFWGDGSKSLEEVAVIAEKI